MNKLKMQTAGKIEENIEYIATRFPNCITESKDCNGKTIRTIDFSLLKTELSTVVVDGQDDRYQFTWADKKKSILLANSPINSTLRPCREESVKFDTTRNLYIEGDNLDVLKLLQETYMGQINMIYIDPPYNTGTDFVYEDNFAMSVEEYLKRNNFDDEDGNRLFQNNDSNGRFHTDWLNMIYPRLKLARELLTNDGAIFISIDDNEVANLKKICDEIYGPRNFVVQMVRRVKAGSGHDSGFLAVEYEYILIYAKNISELKFNKEIVDTEVDAKYRFEDEFISRRGRYYLRDLDYKGSYSQSLDYPITTPDGTTLWAGGHQGAPNTWRWSKQKFEWGIKNGFIVFKDQKVYIKQYQFVDNNDELRVRTLPYRAYVEFLNGEATQEVKELMGDCFSYPKPVSLIKYLLKIATNKDSLILDFFSGSSTTAHAVMQLNSEDNGNRKFIMVQLPEETPESSAAYKMNYKNICDIGKERIRKAGKKIVKENVGKHDVEKFDIGFRVLKLDTSNMKQVFYSPDETPQDLLTDLTNNIKDDRTSEDLVFQVMLDMGVDLSSKITAEVINGKSVYTVGYDNLVCCFDTGVTKETVTEIAKRKPLYAIFRDSSFDSDDILISYDQIFDTYSPTTERRVI